MHNFYYINLFKNWKNVKRLVASAIFCLIIDAEYNSNSFNVIGTQRIALFFIHFYPFLLSWNAFLSLRGRKMNVCVGYDMEFRWPCLTSLIHRKTDSSNIFKVIFAEEVNKGENAKSKGRATNNECIFVVKNLICIRRRECWTSKEMFSIWNAWNNE